jgi:glycosyltransferase involved in cell wall biosynthesis
VKVTAIHRPDDPTSLQIYYERMTSELTTLGIEIIPILEDTIISSNYDLAWDPGMCMRPLTENILTCPIPVIGTMHGVKAYSLPLRELVNSKEEEIELLSTKEILDKQWFKFKKKISALITVSNYGKNEVISALKIRPQKVHVVYNGVDADIFYIFQV